MTKCVKIDIRPKHFFENSISTKSLILFKLTLNISLKWHLKNVNEMCNFGIFGGLNERAQNINHFFREGAQRRRGRFKWNARLRSSCEFH